MTPYRNHDCPPFVLVKGDVFLVPINLPNMCDPTRNFQGQELVVIEAKWIFEGRDWEVYACPFDERGNIDTDRLIQFSQTRDYLDYIPVIKNTEVVHYNAYKIKERETSED